MTDQIDKVAKELKDIAYEMTAIRRIMERTVSIAEKNHDLLTNINEWLVALYNKEKK